MNDVIFTFGFLVVFIIAGYFVFKDDDHDEWRGW